MVSCEGEHANVAYCCCTLRVYLEKPARPDRNCLQTEHGRQSQEWQSRGWHRAAWPPQPQLRVRRPHTEPPGDMNHSSQTSSSFRKWNVRLQSSTDRRWEQHNYQQHTISMHPLIRFTILASTHTQACPHPTYLWAHTGQIRVARFNAFFINYGRPPA